MRVLYVAMTRARDRLIMTYASRTLEDDLKETVTRMDMDRGELLCREAICMGDWILMAAVSRTEAGELHSLGGKPDYTCFGAYPWKIQIVDAPTFEKNSAEASESQSGVPKQIFDRLQKSMLYQYPHLTATRTPSKQTATGRKGRIKDAEAAENTIEPVPKLRSWRRPSFLSDRVEGKTVGNAIHNAMQYIRYEMCGSEESVKKEICRLVDRGFLTKEQGDLVDCAQIARFFATEPGIKLRSGVPHLREFKFSILDAGEHYGKELSDEHVLLQGVVDCALLEEDGITILDFKTDYVTEENLAQRAEYYRPQLEAYSEALSRIYEKKVKACCLYFFRLNRFVEY